jgi:hypothetical protein
MLTTNPSVAGVIPSASEIGTTVKINAPVMKKMRPNESHPRINLNESFPRCPKTRIEAEKRALSNTKMRA